MFEIFFVVAVALVTSACVFWVAWVDRETRREFREDLKRWGR